MEILIGLTVFMGSLFGAMVFESWIEPEIARSEMGTQTIKFNLAPAPYDRAYQVRLESFQGILYRQDIKRGILEEGEEEFEVTMKGELRWIYKIEIFFFSPDERIEIYNREIPKNKKIDLNLHSMGTTVPAFLRHRIPYFVSDS